MLHFEDFPVGEVITFGDRLVTQAEIVAFAREWDPQPFHIDAEAAKDSQIGELIASGWHTGCLLMRMMCDAYLLDSASEGAPGIEELRWLKPVRPGDRLSVRRTTLGARPSRSRPTIGILDFQFEVLNQSGEPVLLLKSASFMEEARMMAFYEDIAIGEERRLGSHAFTREAIVAFARQYDPQRFHIDEEAAKDSIFGGLCASGWHVAAAAMRCIVESRAAALAESVEAAPLGVSPGLQNLRWPHPTRPGDVVAFHNRVIDKRETKRPQWGLVTLRTWGINQDGREAITMENRAFVGRRPQP